MKPEKLSVLYWGLTALVVLIMGVAGVLMLFRLDGALKVIHHLGYPEYFTTLIGLARLAGAAAVLLPVPKGLREWAYAGLTFDLLVTIFSILLSGLPPLSIIQPIIILILVLGSYLCWRKRSALAAGTPAAA
ncbi:MAG: DoxX family protein [Solirubrobacteraceae bacterium]